MSWRVTIPSLPGEYRYRVVCTACGLLRGWQTRQGAARHVSDLEASGWTIYGVEVVEYEDGADGTCPHGASVAERIPRATRQPRRGRLPPSPPIG